jgi:hypothetical protein
MRLSGIVLLASALVLAACSSSMPRKGTQLQSSTVDASVQLQPGKKVLVVFRDSDAAKRREVEGDMAAKVPNAVLGVDILPERAQLKETEATRSRLQAAGIDYVLVLHFDGFSPQIEYRAASVSQQQADPGLYRYLDFGTQAAYTGESVKQRRSVIAQADTSLYEVASGKRVWSAKSQTFNPQSRAEAVSQVIDANAAGLRKAGLIP